MKREKLKYIEGVCLVTDQVTRNGVIYTQEAFEKLSEDINDCVGYNIHLEFDEKELVGTCVCKVENNKILFEGVLFDKVKTRGMKIAPSFIVDDWKEVNGIMQPINPRLVSLGLVKEHSQKEGIKLKVSKK